MNGFLIDTNVISEFIKPRPESRAIQWFDDADPESLFASVITVGEIRLGIEDLLAGKRRAELESWFEFGLPDWFGSHLLPVTPKIADRWARLTIEAKRKGFSLTIPDALIAATAVEHDLVIVTRNVTDFSTCAATIVNPWEV